MTATSDNEIAATDVTVPKVALGIIPASASDLTPTAQAQPATDTSRDSTAMSGLKRIVGRIKDFPHRYTDDSGAHFIKTLYDNSPERALDFFKRLEKEGFRVEMTDEEKGILEGIREKASPFALLPQARIIDGASKLLTRRNLLQKGAYVVAALGYDSLKRNLNEEGARIAETGKDLKAIEEKLEDDIPYDERQQLKQQRLELKKQLQEGTLGTITTTLKDNAGLMTALAVIGFTTWRQGKDVVSHANQKVDKTIDVISRLVDYKLGYTSVPPELEISR